MTGRRSGGGWSAVSIIGHGDSVANLYVVSRNSRACVGSMGQCGAGTSGGREKAREGESRANTNRPISRAVATAQSQSAKMAAQPDNIWL